MLLEKEITCKRSGDFCLLCLNHWPVKINVHDGYLLTFGATAATTMPVFGKRGGMRSNVALL